MIPVHHALWYKTTSLPYRSEVVALLQTEYEVVTLVYDSLTIADARALIEMAYRTPSQYATRALVVVTRSINHEAQHALLKVLEEPPVTTRFIFFVPAAAAILPTIWSRVLVVEIPALAVSDEAFGAFLTLTLPDRISLIAAHAQQKDPAVWSALLDGLDNWLLQNGNTLVAGLEAIAYCRSQLEFRGASKKMLWEELAFTLPVTKR